MTVQQNRHTSHLYTNEELNDFFKNIPNTRYYGSKKRILPWIYQEIKDYEFVTVLDAFGGTASVSLMFQAMQKKVRFNDALLSNNINAKVILNGNFSANIQNDVNLFFQSITPNYSGIISRNYRGVFYTDEENAWLDGALEKIHQISYAPKKHLYLYLIMQAALMKRPFNLFHRANLHLRTAKNIQRQFGNLSTWNRTFPDTIKKLVEDLLQLKRKRTYKAIIKQPLSAEKLSTGYDLVYLDPPYVQKSKKDTYWKKYHFLEGLVQYPTMESLIEKDLKINQLKKNIEMEQWEEPSLFKDKLFKLIYKHRNSIVVLSYMTNAIPSEDELIAFFNDTFSDVKVSYYDLNHVMSKGKKTEILIIGAPR
jgi:adenine-specific DNA-methyltransferase